MTLYFAKGYPEEKKSFFLAPGGIVDQTNAIFEKAGAKIRLKVKNYDEDIPEDADALTKERGREYGDIRYSFIRWMSDLDVGAPFIGVAQFVPDPRTGEAISASINIADFPLKEYVAQRVDAFLQTIMCRATNDENGQKVCAGLNANQPWGPPMREVQKTNAAGEKITELEPLPESCKPGEMAPLLPSRLNETYASSSLYSKMQEYLGEPKAIYGALGPRDFVANQDQDFKKAFLKVLPYYIFADPEANQFVTPVGDGGEFGSSSQYEALQKEVEFHKMSASIDKGEWPFDPNGGVQGVDGFLKNFQQATLDHRDYMYKKSMMFRSSARKMDAAGDLVSFTGIMEKAGRRCVDGHWETREEWLDKLVQTYHSLTVWHEFGHVLGMEHNFMASVDAANYPHYTAENCDPATDATKCDRIGMYSSSVMEYSSTPDRIFWSNESGGPGWAPYDRGAIGFIYSNNTLPPEKWEEATAEAAKKAPEVSGQLSPTLPYNDPEGFRADGKEIQFLYCNESHTRFTPFCRSFDSGSTPSEIIANEIEAYEWQYAWRNFRKYRKVWDLHNYADVPAREIVELRRFLPMWRQDWTANTLRDDFGRFNIELPPGANAKEPYFSQLATKFDDELSQANQMVAAFHLAVIQQSSGERPFATIIDKYNGDVTQQGITLDKNFAMQGWVGLWPSDNYDPNQRGNYISSYGSDFDPEYGALAEKAVASMIGEERFDSFPYLRIAAVVLFARDTHNPNFTGKNVMKEWVGGHLFSRREDMLDYFRQLAIKNPEFGTRHPDLHCDSDKTCDYDPTQPRGRDTTATHLSDTFNEFEGPDHQPYAWVYFPDRRQWVFAMKNRNTATYKLVRDYNENITKPQIEDDRIFNYALPIKYAIDAYVRYETFAP